MPSQLFYEPETEHRRFRRMVENMQPDQAAIQILILSGATGSLWLLHFVIEIRYISVAASLQDGFL
jgi:hypothetical protein